uniref:G domain-containing protein n=1 Tax=Schistosoma japonicum TaxID=6182 RepID=C1LE69_SCHJA|nr:hypothetical protein [Schistosoma japonicum]
MLVSQLSHVLRRAPKTICLCIKKFAHRINTKEQQFHKTLFSERWESVPPDLERPTFLEDRDHDDFLSKNAKSESVRRTRYLAPEDLNKIYSDEDPSLPPLSATCSGCGSPLHCKVAGFPGFIPAAEYKSIISGSSRLFHRSKSRKPVFTLCVRCNLLQRHVESSRETINESCFYSKVIKEIQKYDDAVVVMIADMVNLPHSLIPEFYTELKGRRCVLVGNKADQLPGDGPHFLERWRSVLLEAAISRSKIPNEDVNHVSIISALTGYGIPELIDFLLSKRFHSKSPIYLIGSTNVGKSSLFNRLLLSDLCKSEAKESIHRATISTWPGTTSGLLCFPITLMNSAKRGQRIQSRYERIQQKSIQRNECNSSYGFRYLKPKEIVSAIHDRRSLNYHAVQKARNTLPDLSTMPTYTWEPNEDSNKSGICLGSEFGFEQLTSKFLHGDVFIDNATWDGDQGTRLLTNVLNSRYFNDHAWCYDTPGVLCEDQVLNYLPSNLLHSMANYKSMGTGIFHLSNGVNSRVLIPRTFIMRPGLALLMGLLGRLDVLKAPGSVYFTTFSHLPIHIVSIQEVDEYKSRFSKFLMPENSSDSLNDNNYTAGPCGSLPPMQSTILDPIETVPNLNESNVDVVLSGSGWISIAGLPMTNDNKLICDEKNSNEIFTEHSTIDENNNNNNSSSNTILLSAWTPGALGISVRTSLIPYAIKRRGHRLKWLREFSGSQ